MFEFLILLSGVTLVLSAVGMVKYGFSIVFLYILLFSAVVIIWSVAAILDGKKGKENGGR